MRAKSWIIGIVCFVVLGVSSLMVYLNWNAITGAINGSKYYTEEQLQEKYDEGFNDGTNRETELLDQIEYLKGVNDQYLLDLQVKNAKIADLESNNLNITSELEVIKSEKATIESELLELQKNYDSNTTRIIELENDLELKIAKINELTIEINNNNKSIEDCLIMIENLQKSIDYYENYISNLETEEIVFVTFRFNNSVYSIVEVNKGETVSIENPESTDYIKFNYWMIDNAMINLDSYTFDVNTTVDANVTHYYDAIFLIDGVEYNSQIIVSDGTSTAVEAPVKDGYQFDGWTVDGINFVDPTTVKIIRNTTFVAVYTKLHTVVFLYQGFEYNTEIVRNNELVTVPTTPELLGHTFDGWTVDGTNIIDLTTYKVTSDTTFTAKWTEVNVGSGETPDVGDNENPEDTYGPSDGDDSDSGKGNSQGGPIIETE